MKARVHSARVDRQGSIASTEWLGAALVALFAVALTLIPYVLGYALARPGTQYMGLVTNPEDSQSYFAKMLEGYEGHWLYTIPFTAQGNASAFLGGFYIVLGQLTRVLGLSLIAVWHGSRLCAALIMFMAIFGFVSWFLRDRRQRWTAYLLAIFGSGLGWVLFALNQPYWLGAFPVDFKMSDAHPFFTALAFPHMAIANALILASFWLSLQALDAFPYLGSSQASDGTTRRWIMAGLAGVMNVALAIVYPFLIYLIVTALGLYWVYLCVAERKIQWARGFRLALTFAIPFPLLLYYANTLATNPVFRVWDAQAATPSPPPPHYLIAYGVMLLLAGLLWRVPSNRQFAFLWVWIVACALLVYAPLNPQRRFVQGVQVPLAILATAGLFQLVFPWAERNRFFKWLASRPRYSVAGLERLFVVAFVVFMSISNLYVLVRTSVTMAIEQPYPLFRSTAEVDAVNWLRTQTPHSAVVLGAYETGNYVASQAGNRVVVGHWAETVDFDARLSEVNRFYGTSVNDAWRRQILEQDHVEFVIAGPRERELGQWDPSHASYLEPAFSNAQVTIYRVHHG